jgi:outer membrane lipoprotein-sorting protein
MILLLRNLCFPLLIALFSTTCFAQETAFSLAEKIEKPLIGSAGTSMQFELAGEGKVSLIIKNESNQVRIESPTMLIVSNGKTIWNYDMRADRVTIDNVTSNSPFLQPSGLFLFSKNYSSKITSSDGDNYTLELTPKEKIASILKSAGGIEMLELSLTATKRSVKILKAMAMSDKGETAVSGLAIKPLKPNNLSKYDFNFKPKPSTKVIDLRE